MSYINNHINIKLWDVIIHPCPSSLYPYPLRATHSDKISGELTSSAETHFGQSWCIVLWTPCGSISFTLITPHRPSMALLWVTKATLNSRCLPLCQYLSYNFHSSFKPAWFFPCILMMILKKKSNMNENLHLKRPPLDLGIVAVCYAIYTFITSQTGVQI